MRVDSGVFDETVDAWNAIIGARMYASLSDTTPVQVSEFEHTWLFDGAADPADINDPTLEALFEDAEDLVEDLEDEIAALLKELEIKMKVLEELKEEVVFDAADAEFTNAETAALFANVKASQSINTAYKTVPEVTLPDQLEFIFSADIPTIALEDGAVIYQFLTLTEGSDTVSVECKVSVGNPDGVKTNVFSDGGLDKATAKAKTWSSLGQTKDTELVASHNFGQEYFKLKESKTDRVNN